MRSLGLIFAAILPLAACAKDPSYGTGQAGSSGNAGTSGGGSGGGYMPPALKLSHPNPIISRGAQVFSMPPNGNGVVNGAYHNGGWTVGKPTEAAPAWVAIKLAAGPTRILVSWDDGGTYDYKDPVSATVYGLPADYHFEVATTTTNGTDGDWTIAGDAVTGNQVRTRAHAIDFTGKTWIKMVITAAPANESSNGVQIGEIDVHDISATGTGLPEDTWFFMGDSITAFAFDRAAVHQPSFAAAISTATAMAYLPAMINGGIGSEKSADGVARLAEALTLNPDYHFFALGYGTNDAANNQISPTTFKANMQTMIDMVKAAGRVPVIAHIPFAGDGSHGNVPTYNAAIDELARDNQLQIGPDLYTHFMQHADDEFVCPPCAGHPYDKLHPNDTGLTAINQLWADAMRVVYP